MSSKPLPTQSLLELIDLFEQSGQPILDGDGQRLHGVPGWSAFGRTSLTAKQFEHWADCVGYAGSYLEHFRGNSIEGSEGPKKRKDVRRHGYGSVFR